MTKRKIKRRRHPAQEYIILVGGPSNTFNGYFHYDGTASDIASTPPADTSDAQIRRYLRGDGTHTAVDDPQRTGTHDLYWANFLYSAVKLVESGAMRPERGDILTYILWMPPLIERIAVDWAASPYNPIHASSSWVANARPYNRAVRAADQKDLWWWSQYGVPAPTSPIVYGTSQPDIDHEILMRTTDELGPDGGFHKRAHSIDDYENAIAEIPRRLVGSTVIPTPPPVVRTVPFMHEVQVKLLLMTDVQEFYDYVQLGQWSNTVRWQGVMDLYDEEAMANYTPMAECGWMSHALTKGGVTLPGWEAAPSVDRSHVKIKRFDYFGHSTFDAFFLSYGVHNAKGTIPTSEATIGLEWATQLSADLFADGSTGYLWGCFLGRDLAPMLAQFMTSVVGCESRTTFDHILDDGVKLPEPADPDNFPFIYVP